MEPRVAVLGGKDEGGGLAAVTLLIASSEEGTDNDGLCSLVMAVPKKIRNEYDIELNDNKQKQNPMKGRTTRIESVQSYTNSSHL